jgi:carbohydrate-selective porin OprB
LLLLSLQKMVRLSSLGPVHATNGVLLLALLSVSAAAGTSAASAAAAGSGSISAAAHKLVMHGMAAEAIFAATIDSQLSCKRAGFYWHGVYCSPCPADHYWNDTAGLCAPRETTAGQRHELTGMSQNLPQRATCH